MPERTHSKIFGIPLSIEKWLLGSKWEALRNKELDITMLTDGDKRQLGKIGIETGLWRIEKRLYLVLKNEEIRENSEKIWNTPTKAIIKTRIPEI